jgi:hypothetical protein
VDQIQLGIEEVKVQHTLLSACANQTGPTFTVPEFEAWAALHAAEDTNQSRVDRSLSKDVIDKSLLAMSALKVPVFDAGPLGHVLGVVDHDLGLFLSKGHEITATDLQDVVDEAFERLRVGDVQIALEDHPIEAREHCDDQLGKLGDEARQRVHGVLLQYGMVGKPILEAERRYCSNSLKRLAGLESCASEAAGP